MKNKKNKKDANNINPKFKQLTAKDILSHKKDLKSNMTQKKSEIGIFSVKLANKWLEDASKRPIPNMLFSELWYEGEICILFADTNLGKSILAVQIGDSISKGRKIPYFKFEAKKHVVVYFDFELSDKQFEGRYSDNYKNHYSFNDSFFRCEISADNETNYNKKFEDLLKESIERTIKEKNPSVLIIDNITFMHNEIEKSKHAGLLMKYLKDLGRKYNLSILVIAHTPKRDLSKSITNNDLAGSKMLINFCDSVFAIGTSSLNPSYKYIKQIKARNTEILYHLDNIIVCEIVKNNNFLKFEFVEYGNEQDHIRDLSGISQNERIQEAKQMKAEGKSNVEIAAEFNVTEGAVRKWLKKQ